MYINEKGELDIDEQDIEEQKIRIMFLTEIFLEQLSDWFKRFD